MLHLFAGDDYVLTTQAQNLVFLYFSASLTTSLTFRNAQLLIPNNLQGDSQILQTGVIYILHVEHMKRFILLIYLKLLIL